MQFRVLGNSDLRVSAVGLGCMGITHASGAPMDKNEGANYKEGALWNILHS